MFSFVDDHDASTRCCDDKVLVAALARPGRRGSKLDEVQHLKKLIGGWLVQGLVLSYGGISYPIKDRACFLPAVDTPCFRRFQAEISDLARGNSIHQKHFEGGKRDS